jgi:glycine oxidase
MSGSVAIVGAGVIGRMVALGLVRGGWSVTLYDRDDERCSHSCSWTGAGMISPYCERVAAERLITDLGAWSAERWPSLLATLAAPVFHRTLGSLVVAHPSDRDELERLRRRVEETAARPDAMRPVRADELRELEPELAGRFSHALYFPLEGHLDNRGLMDALGATLRSAGAAWQAGAEVQRLENGRVMVSNAWKSHDWVVDCRGLGAQADLQDLRGVRGELLYLHAPDAHLRRPVRLMHPRYSIYIVPRANGTYVVGATSIESDDGGPITVRSALELLSAAYSVHTGFAEARLLECSVSCRPAFPDNHPRIEVRPGLMRVNGMYRHGFLIAPAMADAACAILRGEEPPALVRTLVKEDV